MVDLRVSKSVLSPTRFRPRRSTTLPVPATTSTTPIAAAAAPHSPAPPMNSPADKQPRRVPVGSRSGPISSPTSPLISPPPRATINTGHTGSPAPSHPGTDDLPYDGFSLNSTGGGGGSSSGTPRDRSNSANAVYASSSRDEQIACLQRELAAKDLGFQRELEKLVQNENETSAYWQSKHSALHLQFLQTDAELRVLRSDLDARDQEAVADQAECEALRMEVRSREEEVRLLRSQVRGLKEWVSTSTRAEGQTSDEVFAENVARLSNGLQNWVIVNFRRARMDLGKMSPEIREELARLVPNYRELASTSKLHLLQAIVSAILVDMIFNAYFVGLNEEQTRKFREMEDLISSLAVSLESVNHWRAATLTILRREAAAANMQPEADRSIDTIVSRINHILDSITASSTASIMLITTAIPSPTLSATTPDSASTTAPTPTGSATLAPVPTQPVSAPSRDAQALRALVASATDLARQLASQRAAFSMHIPFKAVFDPKTMEDVGGEDDEALVEREVRCVVFPGVIKRGDERGMQLQFENVIAKARVLLCPEEG